MKVPQPEGQESVGAGAMHAANTEAIPATAAGDIDIPSTLPEAERLLMERARRGDVEATRELLTLHREALFAIAWTYLGNREEALDAVQESLAKALGHARSYDPRRPISAWLTRITRNTCLDRLRRLRHRRHASLEDRREAGLPDPRSYRPSPEADVLRRELSSRLREALSGLRPIEREVIVLRDVLEWSYGEIESYLGLTHGTVASLIHRARARLRARLAPYVARYGSEEHHGS